MKTVARLLGLLLVLVGVAIFVSVSVKVHHSDTITRDEQQQLNQQLKKNSAPGASPIPSTTAFPEGEALAVLRIPRFGADYDPVVVEGVSQEDLQKGPGHFPGTALPGQIGNFSVAGHQWGYDSVFGRLTELQPGDAISVEFQGRSYTYHVTQKEVVEPTNVGVVLPVPNKPGEMPTVARLTLVTCYPNYSNSHRLIISAELS